jgi:dipeptidyl aminopeptidase/acylaminoacyl peptidase
MPLLSTKGWFLLAFAAWGATSAQAQATRPFTVTDAIELTHVVRGRDGPMLYSPDRRQFLVQTTRGDLRDNVTEDALWLFDMAEVEAAAARQTDPARPLGRILLTRRSTSNDPAIRQVRWIEDGRAIAFIGESPHRPAQVYTYNLKTGVLTRRTNSTTSVISYDLNGRAIIHSAVYTVSAESLKERAKDGFVAGDETLAELVNPEFTNWDWMPDFTTHVVRLGQRQVVTLDEHPIRQPNYTFDYWLSPDGRYAVGVRRVTSIPKLWESYLSAFGDRRHYRETPEGKMPRHGFTTQFVLIDTRSGRVRPIVRAPIGEALGNSSPRRVIWSRDGKRAVVAATFLPLDDSVSSEERERRRRSAAVIEVEVPANTVRVVSYLGAGEDSLKDTSVSVIEDLNTPPRVVATNVVLRDFNPQLAELRLSRWEVFKWTDPRGKEWEGRVLRPTDFEEGKRYPLVIQTHGFLAGHFIVDGLYSSAFPAQPLANRGFMVLLVPDDAEAMTRDAPGEGAVHMGAYETAIAELERRGWVDSLKVGLIGFSRTRYHVLYALSHSKVHFAAATAADGVDMGYWQYLYWSQGYDPVWPATFESRNGGNPFVTGFGSWLDHAPGFNAGRITTPLRTEVYGREGVLHHWEMHAALKRLNRPTELVFFEDGTHLLVKPRQRYASLQGNVDWFSFWLKREEDPEPAKAEQYARWRELRKLEQATRDTTETAR